MVELNTAKRLGQAPRAPLRKLPSRGAPHAVALCRSRLQRVEQDVKELLGVLLREASETRSLLADGSEQPLGGEDACRRGLAVPLKTGPQSGCHGLVVREAAQITPVVRGRLAGDEVLRRVSQRRLFSKFGDGTNRQLRASNRPCQQLRRA